MKIKSLLLVLVVTGFCLGAAACPEEPQSSAAIAFDEPIVCDKPIWVEDKDLDEKILKSDKLVMIDFWNRACGPCRKMEEEYDIAAQERSPKALGVDASKCNVVVYKVDDEKNPATTKMFQHGKAIPLAVFVYHGHEIHHDAGYQDAGGIINMMEDGLAVAEDWQSEQDENATRAEESN